MVSYQVDQTGWLVSPGLHLSLSPQSWDYTCMPRCLFFLVCFVLHPFWGIELKSPFMDRAISSAPSELDFLLKRTRPSCSSWRGNSKEKSVGGAKVFVLKQMTADWLPPGKGVPTSWKGALEVTGGRSQGMTVPWAERQKCGYLIKYLSSWET